jgi:hypothetical protein
LRKATTAKPKFISLLDCEKSFGGSALYRGGAGGKVTKTVNSSLASAPVPMHPGWL